jgi:hypothetical protein
MNANRRALPARIPGKQENGERLKLYFDRDSEFFWKTPGREAKPFVSEATSLSTSDGGLPAMW